MGRNEYTHQDLIWQLYKEHISFEGEKVWYDLTEETAGCIIRHAVDGAVARKWVSLDGEEIKLEKFGVKVIENLRRMGDR